MIRISVWFLLISLILCLTNQEKREKMGGVISKFQEYLVLLVNLIQLVHETVVVLNSTTLVTIFVATSLLPVFWLCQTEMMPI